MRKKYPESYTDCGTNDGEQCPKGYPGAQKYSKEWNEVMKFTSAVKMFGKSALKKIRKSRDKKAAVASGGQQKNNNALVGQCPPGHYAEATAPKPSKAVPDITLKSKTGKLLGTYNCKGDPSCPPPPPGPTSP